MKWIVLGLALPLSTAFASTVELNSRHVSLGNVGSIRSADFDQNATFDLVRTEQTPNRVVVNFDVTVFENQCVSYSTRTYPCGRYYDVSSVDEKDGGPGHDRPSHGGNPRPNPGHHPTPNPGPHPGNYHPRPGYPQVCYDTICNQYAEVPVNREMSAILKFRKALDLSNGMSERITLKARARGNDSVSYQASIDNADAYNVNVDSRRIRFIAK